MADQRSPRRRLLRGASLLPAAAVGSSLLAGCAAPRVVETGPPLPAPQMKVGDTWIYREINRYNGSEVARVEETITAITPMVVMRVRVIPGEFSAGRAARAGNDGEARYDSQWRVSRELAYDMPCQFETPMPMLPARLQAGQSGSDRTTYTVPGISGRYGWRQRLTTLGSAVVDTPAGRFTTLHVRREISLDLPDPFRYDGSRTDELFYAPEVNRWVRREWQGRYRHESHLDRFGTFLQEDWVRRDLVEYRPAR